MLGAMSNMPLTNHKVAMFSSWIRSWWPRRRMWFSSSGPESKIRSWYVSYEALPRSCSYEAATPSTYTVFMSDDFLGITSSTSSGSSAMA